jgi:serine/threonine-protein kinase RsbW
MDPNLSRQLHLRIGSRFENIELVQMTVDETLHEAGATDEQRHWIGLALREAVANAIKHGNRQQAAKQVDVKVDLAGGELEIQIADQGEGFDPERVKDPLAPENRFRADGRGIFYMRKFMDDVRYGTRPEGGTVVILRKRLLDPARSGSER